MSGYFRKRNNSVYFNPAIPLQNNPDISSYRIAADKVKSRLGMVRFVDCLITSRWAAFLLTIGAVIFVRQQLGWRSGEVWVVAGLLIVWIAIGWAWGNFVYRPDSLTSLSIFDYRGGWKDQFSSAWTFLTGENARRQEPTRGESLHLARAGKQLPGALTRLKQLIPLPSVKWLWLLPLSAILFSVLPLLRPGIAPGDVVLTQEMKDAAAGQGEQIKAENERVKNVDSLSEEEKDELEKLRSEVDSVAEELASAEGATAMDLLEALESRARAAERLARKLGLDEDVWASEVMLKEMGQHPDVADLVLAIKDKKADLVARESDKIAAVLKQREITKETENRITASLEQTMEKATENDLEKPVGERAGNASIKMLDHQTVTAAREFEELAKHFRTVRDRENARKKLEELAAKLREAGGEISGSKVQKMKQMAAGKGEKNAAPQGLKSLETNPLANQIQNITAPQSPLAGQMGTTPKQGKNGDQKIPIPGAGSNPKSGKNQNQQNGLAAPIPGQGQQEGGKGMAKNGSEKNGKGQGGALSAPIPGMAPDENTTSGQGDSAEGDSVSSNGAQGGNEAGQGTAAMVENKTDTLKPTKDSKVVTQISKTGESTTRAVEGKIRSEAAERSRQDIMKEFIAVEEQALDGKTLPMSRRAHVLRYFSEIRNQFEKESKK